MASTARNRIHAINLQAQLLALLKAIPGSSGTVRRSHLSWQAEVTPTTRSITYRVQVSYCPADRRPQVAVLSPPLTERGEGQPIPHVFPGNRPCLHFGHEWNGGMWMNQTLVPWISEWLFFYELWLATGTWLGGGHEGSKPRTATESRSD
jgi:hypothetical protein